MVFDITDESNIYMILNIAYDFGNDTSYTRL